VKVQLESTTKIVKLNGIDCRVWEGITEHGIKCHAYIPRIAASPDQDLSQFDQELAEQRPPSPEIEAIPMRMVL
jgi:hypothetical protein